MNRYDADRIASVLEEFLKMYKDSIFLHFVGIALLFFLIATPLVLARIARTLEKNEVAPPKRPISKS